MLRNGGFLIAKIHQLSGRIFAKKLREHQIEDLNPAQGRILFALWQGDGLSVQELSRKTALDKSTLSSMLSRLESSGHVSRGPAVDDRRVTLVYLTPKNREHQATYNQVSHEMTELYYDGFSAEEIDRFERHLERILENLQRHEET